MKPRIVLLAACAVSLLGAPTRPASALDSIIEAVGSTLNTPISGDVTGSCIEPLVADFQSVEVSWIQSNDIQDTNAVDTYGFYPDPGDLAEPRLVATLQPGNVPVVCTLADVLILDNNPDNLNHDAYGITGSDCTCGSHPVNFAVVFLRDSTGSALDSDSIPNPFPTEAVFDYAYHFRIEGCLEEPCGGSTYFDARFPIDEIRYGVPEPSTGILQLAALMTVGALGRLRRGARLRTPYYQ